MSFVDEMCRSWISDCFFVFLCGTVKSVKGGETYYGRIKIELIYKCFWDKVLCILLELGGISKIKERVNYNEMV